jgi:hypothetical protein
MIKQQKDAAQKQYEAADEMLKAIKRPVGTPTPTPKIVTLRGN